MSCDVNLILKKNGILSNKNGSQMNKKNIKIFNSYIYRINKKKKIECIFKSQYTLSAFRISPHLLLRERKNL